MTIKNPAGLGITYVTDLIDVLLSGHADNVESVKALIQEELAGSPKEFTFEATLNLANGESVTFDNLGYGSSYSFTEVGAEGYTPSVGELLGTPGGNLTVDGTIKGEDVTVEYVNTVAAPYYKTEGMNLSTAIQVRFNVVMPGGAEAYPDSYMTFTIQYKDGELFRMDTADAVRISDYNGQPRYRFYCPINAIQMADKITPVLHYKDADGNWLELTREPFSAQDYLEKALNDQTGAITDALRALALATADYGHYAQLYLQTVHSASTYGEHNVMPRYGTGSFDYDATYAAVEACAIVRNPVGDIESIAFSHHFCGEIRIRRLRLNTDHVPGRFAITGHQRLQQQC